MTSPDGQLTDSVLDVLALRQSLEAPYLFDARSGRRLTYAQLHRIAGEQRCQLREWGIDSSQRVGLLCSDPLTFATWFLAALSMGVWVAPLDPTPGTLSIASAQRTLRLDAIVSDTRPPSPSTVTWHHIVGEVTGDGVKANDDRETSSVAVPELGGVLLSSSGTTGTAKVMALSVEQLLGTARLVARHHALTPSDRGFSPLPLWHINAEVVGLLATLVAGSSLVLDDRFHRTGFWKIVADFDVTWINAVPAIIARLVDLGSDESVPCSVRFIRSASAPLSAALAERFEDATGIVVIQSYGMTEAASQICVNPIDGPRKGGSVGVAAGVDVRVVGHDGTPTTSIGAIEIKGPTVIRRYDSSELSDRFNEHGWLHTGDLGYFDDDGYLFIVGRDDDVINRGGEKVYPLVIENALANVDGVMTVAVVAGIDDVFGQTPVAFVRPADGSTLTSEEAMKGLVEKVHERSLDALAKAQRPTAIKIVRDFPTHSTGKIATARLRRGDVTVLFEATY